MATLSLSMIARNEERTLSRILGSARSFCDQMVVVDTGSHDGTVAAAREAGAEVHHFTWVDDFAAARNHALTYCRGDWIIWLDADDVIVPAVQAYIAALKHTWLERPDLHTIMASYHWTWDAQGRPIERFDRERLVRRSPALRWYGPVHEVLVTPQAGRVRLDDVYVEHRTHPANVDRKKGRNLAIYEKWLDPEASDLHSVYQYGCELQWNSRLADAAGAFEIFLRRAHGLADVLGEQYLARIKAGECRFITGDPKAGLGHYEAAIALDGRRAEARTLAGELLFAQRRFAEARQHLAAAAALSLPAYDGRYLFPWFYGDRPRRALEACERQMPTAARG